MAAIASSQQRRRPATYGKPSRKRVNGHEHKPILSQGLDTRHWDDEPISDRSGEEPSISTQIHHGVNQSKNTLGHRSSSGAVAKSKLYTRRNRVQDMRSTALQTSRSPMVNTSAIFDIPSSSDDEVFIPSKANRYLSNKVNGQSEESHSAIGRSGVHGSSHLSIDESQGGVTKSSVRTQTTTPNVQNGLVFDDDTLQQHIAAEQSMLDAGWEPPSRNGRRHTTAQRSITVQSAKKTIESLAHKSEHSNPIKPPFQASVQKTLRSVSPGLAQGGRRARESHETIPKKRRRLAGDKEQRYKGVSAPAALQSMLPGQESALPLPDHSKCHPTLPSLSHSDRLPANARRESTPHAFMEQSRSEVKSKPTPVTTTPRQRRMWNKLLDDGLSNHSPSHLKMKRLSISACEESGAGPKGVVKDRSAAAATLVGQHQPAQSSRQRLIDAIGSTRTESHLRRKFSVEESDECGAESAGSSVRSLSPENNNNDQADTSATSGSQAISLDSLPDGNVAPSLLPAVALQGGPKITYARQRSHLTEGFLQEEDLFQAPLDLALVGRPSNSRRAAGKAPSKLNLPQNPEEVNGINDENTNGAIRSIHELREAGGNKRFLDSMDAIFEDIEPHQPSTVSRRRGCLMDLSIKLADRNFSRRFLEHGLDQRLFVDLAFEHDTVVGFLLASAMLFVISTGAATHTFSYLRTQGATRLMVRLLEAEQDISVTARQRQSNMSKVSQSLLREVRELLQHSSIWGSDQPSDVSPRTVALKCLEAIVRQSRTSGAAISILSQAVVERLVHILQSCAVSTTANDQSITRAIELENALSILELCTIKGDINEAHWTPNTVSSLSETLSTICSWQAATSRQIQTLALRLTINLTNNNATLCDAFATSTLIGANVGTITRSFDFLSAVGEEGERLLAVDRLVLALGSLINFAEWSDISRLVLMETRDSRTTLLDELLELFGRGVEKALLVSDSRRLFQGKC